MCQEEVSVVAVSKALQLDAESAGNLKDVLFGAACSLSVRPRSLHAKACRDHFQIHLLFFFVAFFLTHLKPQSFSNSFILLACIMENVRLQPLLPSSAFPCPSVRVVIVDFDSL